MNVCGQDMKVTLTVNGRKMTFSEQELTAILEKHFSNEATEKMVVQVPIEDKWFEVNPQAIDQNLFKMEREDKREEITRNLILEAFSEVKRNPEKYGKKFETMMPKKRWSSKTVEELKQLACELGDHNADWVHQSLEWAQRIFNGESWEAICNNSDAANWYRLIIWKNGYARIVGGSNYDYNPHPWSYINNYNYGSSNALDHTVPLIVKN